jgi:hypothetical protein
MDENLRMAGTEARPTGHFHIKASVLKISFWRVQANKVIED